MIVNCVAYQEGKKLGDIPTEKISDYMMLPNCFVWVALKDPEPQELQQMQEEFGLHELAVEDAHHGHQRPKIEEYGDSLFAVLHTLELTGEELSQGEVAIFVGHNYVLSVRMRTKKGFQEVRTRSEREPHLLKNGPSFVFYALMDATVDRYFPVIDAFETELERVEEEIFNRKTSARDNIERLYDLKQKVMSIKHAVAPLMEATSKLYGGRVPAVCFTTQEYFRDIYDHLYRINLSIEVIRETITTAIQVSLSLVTIEEGEVNKRLAAWAAIFAAATALAGIWGMNFEFMPELKWKYGYPAALSLMIGVCSYLYYRFKKSRWL